MSGRDDDRRLADVEAAITAIDRHLKRGAIDDELVFDACRARLIEIGCDSPDLELVIGEANRERADGRRFGENPSEVGLELR